MVEFLQTNWIFGIGFFAQAIFGLRVLVQWWMAEKKGQAVSPALFWKFSLAGSVLFLIYGILRHDIVIILGQVIAYFIYIRNLQLKKDWNNFPFFLRAFLLIFPGIVLLWSSSLADQMNFINSFKQDWSPVFWAGIIGQLLLNFRFMYQLYVSEQHKKSLLPKGFWWISLTGSAFVIIYSIYRQEPVLLVAQSLALLPYIRNIILSKN